MSAERLVVDVEARREAALVADGGRLAARLQQLLQVWKTSTPARSASSNRSKPGRDDHELLDVEVVVGVRAAVDDVHQRDGQVTRADAAEVAVERQLVRRRPPRARPPSRRRGSRSRRGSTCSACRRARSAPRRPRPDRVASMPMSVGRDHVADVLDRLQHALAEVALRVAVAQLERLVLAGRGAGRNGRAAERAAVEADLGLDGGVATRIQNLARVEPDDLGHGADTTPSMRDRQHGRDDQAVTITP